MVAEFGSDDQHSVYQERAASASGDLVAVVVLVIVYLTNARPLSSNADLSAEDAVFWGKAFRLSPWKQFFDAALSCSYEQLRALIGALMPSA
jgi:hypothetical protein